MIYISLFQTQFANALINNNVEEFFLKFDKKISFLPKFMQRFIYFISFRTINHVFEIFSFSNKGDSIYELNIFENNKELFKFILNKLHPTVEDIKTIISFNYLQKNEDNNEIFLDFIFENPELIKLYFTALQNIKIPEYIKWQQKSFERISKKIKISETIGNF